MQSCYDSVRVSCNDCQEGTGRRFGCAPPSFPVLHGVKTETKRVGKPGLRHIQRFADDFHNDISGYAYFIVGLLTRQEGINLIESGHHIFKHGGHGLPLVFGEDFVGTLGKLVAFSLRQAVFLVLRICSDEEDRELLVAEDINHTRPAALSHTAAADTHFAKSASPLYHVAAFWIG